MTSQQDPNGPRSLEWYFEPGRDKSGYGPAENRETASGHVEPFYPEDYDGLEPGCFVFTGLEGTRGDAAELRRRFLESWNVALMPCGKAELDRRLAWMVQHGHNVDPPPAIVARALEYIHPEHLVERIRRLELGVEESCATRERRITWHVRRKKEVENLHAAFLALRSKLEDADSEETNVSSSSLDGIQQGLEHLQFTLGGIVPLMKWRLAQAKRLERSLAAKNPLHAGVYRLRRIRYYSPVARDLNRFARVTWEHTVELLIGDHWREPLCPTYVGRYRYCPDKLVDILKHDPDSSLE